MSLIWRSALNRCAGLFTKHFKRCISPCHVSWVGERCLLPIGDTVTPCEPPYHAAPAQWGYCQKTKRRVKQSDWSKVKG